MCGRVLWPVAFPDFNQLNIEQCLIMSQMIHVYLHSDTFSVALVLLQLIGFEI